MGWGRLGGVGVFRPGGWGGLEQEGTEAMHIQSWGFRGIYT